MNKILLVEDAEPFATNLQNQLTEYGFDCSKVNNGEEAIELLKSNEYHGIILDLKLVDTSSTHGIGVLDWISKNNSSLATLVITAHAHLLPRVLEYEVDQFFMKPIDEKYIVTYLAKSISLRILKKENIRLRKLNRILMNTYLAKGIPICLFLAGFIMWNYYFPKDYLGNIMLFIIWMIFTLGGKRITNVVISFLGQKIEIEGK